MTTFSSARGFRPKASPGGSDQDDGVYGPQLPSQGDRGSCTAVTVATDHQDLERSRRTRAEMDQ